MHAASHNPNPEILTVCGRTSAHGIPPNRVLSLEAFNALPQRQRCRSCDNLLTRTTIAGTGTIYRLPEDGD